MYSHLKRIDVNEGQSVNPKVPWEAATIVGEMGNTGLSTAAHLHIAVVKGLQFVLWRLIDMYNGNKEPVKSQLDFFISENDSTLFGVNPYITVEWDDQWYIDNRGKRHLAKDCVPINRKETNANFNIFWNRKFAGRVLKTGYDYAYGNYVLIGYDTLDGDEWIKGDDKVIVEPNEPNDVTADWQNSVSGYLYTMTNDTDVKSTYGQSNLYNGKIRYIKVHPNNFGIIDADATVDKTNYSGINGTFFWYDSDGSLYPTSILKIKNKVFRNEANHLPSPQGVLCYYQDGTFGVEQLKYATYLSKPVWWAIGGIEYVRDGSITYDKYAEGFTGAYADVHRTTNHSSIGITNDNNILLVRHWSSDRDECAEHMKALGCKYAVGLDGGGSTQYVVPDKSQSRYSIRKVANQFVATDLPV
jgi:hypothetical protein